MTVKHFLHTITTSKQYISKSYGHKTNTELVRRVKLLECLLTMF